MMMQEPKMTDREAFENVKLKELLDAMNQNFARYF